MWFDGQRQPNTIYVANTSRGKDSTAMLRAIQLLGFPLDMIVSIDIWATQDIPAELPPMVKFKDEYDRKVLEWFGIPVTRLCATKRSLVVQVERERERERTAERVSYESLFYKNVVTDKYAGHIWGFPTLKGGWCKTLKDTDKPRFDFSPDLRGHLLSADNTQERERERERGTPTAFARGEETSEYTDSHFRTERGATATSNARYSRIPESNVALVQRRTQKGHTYGFPMHRGNWCTGLKTTPYNAPGRGAENKYRPLCRHSG